jgi:hypothetical protein
VVAGLDAPSSHDDDGTLSGAGQAQRSGMAGGGPSMIECIFTVDYEIYGNGTGSLSHQVYEPTDRLADLFQRHGAKFVVFVETAELARIEEYRTDPAIDLVKKQIRNLDRAGFEIGLHIHPWWCNARHDGVQWILDLKEYNLGTLPKARISNIISEGICYLKHLVNRPDFTPISFRAGSWLFQPTEPMATILALSGICIDSSVFPGGWRHDYGMDYRKTPKGHYYWAFREDILKPSPQAALYEIPIHTVMVRFWRMEIAKRLAFGNAFGATARTLGGAATRMRDFLRFRQPLKLDFCRLTSAQMIATLSEVLNSDRKEPNKLRPIVAIGHTKDLSDYTAVDEFLTFLRANGITISTFRDVYSKITCVPEESTSAANVQSTTRLQGRVPSAGTPR